jgi:hypothetical protein
LYVFPKKKNYKRGKLEISIQEDANSSESCWVAGVSRSGYHYFMIRAGGRWDRNPKTRFLDSVMYFADELVSGQDLEVEVIDFGQGFPETFQPLPFFS